MRKRPPSNQIFNLALTRSPLELKMTSRWLAWLVFLSLFGSVPASYLGDEMVLIETLTRNYSKYGRPVRNASTAVVVKVDLALAKIVDVDLKNEMIVTNVQVMQEWQDEFLRWDPRLYNGLLRIEIPSDLIWVPDIVLVNDVADYRELKSLPKAVALYTGTIMWNPRMQLKSACTMDATFFPFDIQQCYLVFFSWTYSGEKVSIQSGHVGSIIFVDKSYVATAFDIRNSSLQQLTELEYWPTGEYNLSSTYTQLVYGLELKRKILYHTYTVLWPSLIISILTILIFRLSPDSGEKIELGVSILLVFHVMLWTIGEKLPENSNGIPLLAIYLTAVMTLTSLSVIMSIVVINIHSMGTTKEVPKWVRLLFLEKCGPFFGIENRRKVGVLNELVSRSAMTFEATGAAGDAQTALITLLRLLAEKHRKEAENTDIAQEWRFLAMIIDRLLFYIYLIFTTILTVFFLFVYPSIQHLKPLDMANM